MPRLVGALDMQDSILSGINGYADIYKGALNLIEDVVQQVNNLLDYLEVDTKIDEETSCVRIQHESKIIKRIIRANIRRNQYRQPEKCASG